eukprot:scaffold88599_cov17-Tisochrysis_lutea.AAC.2
MKASGPAGAGGAAAQWECSRLPGKVTTHRHTHLGQPHRQGSLWRWPSRAGGHAHHTSHSWRHCRGRGGGACGVGCAAAAATAAAHGGLLLLLLLLCVLLQERLPHACGHYHTGGHKLLLNYTIPVCMGRGGG